MPGDSRPLHTNNKNDPEDYLKQWTQMNGRPSMDIAPISLLSQRNSGCGVLHHILYGLFEDQFMTLCRMTPMDFYVLVADLGAFFYYTCCFVPPSLLT
jgi:hypothetical protein